MGTASCSLLYTLRFTSSLDRRYGYSKSVGYNHSGLHLFPSFSSTLSRNFSFPGKCLQLNRFTALSSSSSSSLDQNPSHEFAILLEVDGVLIDAYRFGNRQAFNVAFQKLGLDCANWSEPVYLDLARKSSGNEERMLVLYFERIGWPSSLPTSEKAAFVKRVLQEKKDALDEFLMSNDSPLRPGVEGFIDDAWNEGIPVVILTSYSKGGDKISSSSSQESITNSPHVMWRSIIEKLGVERISKIKIAGDEEVNQSLYGQLVLGKRIPSGLDEQLAKEASKAASAEKQRIAEEVASMLKLSVEIDTGSAESLEKVVAALRAGAEYAGLPVKNCMLIAGSKPGVAGAERIGMPCVVLRSSSTSRAEFPSAYAIMDGFGGADLTINKLLQKRRPGH